MWFLAFSRSPLGRANTLAFLSLLLNPRISLKVLVSFTLFCSASLALDSILSFASVLYLPQTCLWTVSLLEFLLFNRLFHAYSPTHPTLFQLALVLLSPIQPRQLLLATSLLSCSVLSHVCISAFSRLHLFRVDVFPNSALRTVCARRV